MRLNERVTAKLRSESRKPEARGRARAKTGREQDPVRVGVDLTRVQSWSMAAYLQKVRHEPV